MVTPDRALQWTLHCVEPVLHLTASVKLWEISLSVIINYPPKSSYSAFASLRGDGVHMPFHGADILGLMSRRKVLN